MESPIKHVTERPCDTCEFKDVLITGDPCSTCNVVDFRCVSKWQPITILKPAEYISAIHATIPEDPPQTLGVKHDQGKAPMSLLDRKWLEGTAQVLRFGAQKYAAHNWRKGLPVTRVTDAALRHIMAFLDGEDTDPESGLPHLDHASCCLMFASNMHKTRPDMDDRHNKETDATE